MSNENIVAARARWAAKQAQAADEKHQEAEEMRKKVLSVFREGWWALEYVGKIKPPTRDVGCLVTLNLPGCSPLKVEVWDKNIPGFYVDDPMEVKYRDGAGWFVATSEHYVRDVDEAIDLAASYGESWFEMQVEADRRNAAGLRPTPEPLPGQAAARALAEARNAYNGAPEDTNALLSAVAAGVLAVAQQLALLNDTLMKMDR